MSEDRTRPRIDKVIKSISTKATEVREGATELSKLILEFQETLGNLPGRIESYAFGHHPDRNTSEEPLELGLRLHREGKGWLISWGDYNPGFHDEETPMSWKPLHEAPLKIKIAAFKIFPDLLMAIETSQDRLAAEIADAKESYKALTNEMKADLKEGK